MWKIGLLAWQFQYEGENEQKGLPHLYFENCTPLFHKTCMGSLPEKFYEIKVCKNTSGQNPYPSKKKKKKND